MKKIILRICVWLVSIVVLLFLSLLLMGWLGLFEDDGIVTERTFPIGLLDSPEENARYEKLKDKTYAIARRALESHQDDYADKQDPDAVVNSRRLWYKFPQDCRRFTVNSQQLGLQSSACKNNNTGDWVEMRTDRIF